MITRYLNNDKKAETLIRETQVTKTDNEPHKRPDRDKHRHAARKTL